MSYFRTRQDVVDKAIRDAHTPIDQGTSRSRTMHFYAVEEYDRGWVEVVKAKTAGIGRTTRAIAVLTGAETFDLPIEWLFLRAFVRSDLPAGQTPAHVSDEQALINAWIDDGVRSREDPPYLQGAYYLEGGGSEFDEGSQSLVPVARRVRIMPPAKSDMTVTMLYITQAQSFGDPSNPADDGTTVDFFTEPNFRLNCDRVRLKAAGRGDTAEYQKALAATQSAVADSLTQMAPDQHKAVDTSAWVGQRDGGGVGY